MIYAGIGSRNTPEDILRLMEAAGELMCKQGYTLRTGNCIGADQAFQRGTNKIDPTKVHLFLPWSKYEKQAIVPGNTQSRKLTRDDFEEASKYHPAWDMCGDAAMRFYTRNTQIILGEDFKSHASMVICWTQSEKRGGTSQGIRIAKELDIPVYNMAGPNGLKFVLGLLEENV